MFTFNRRSRRKEKCVKLLPSPLIYHLDWTCNGFVRVAIHWLIIHCSDNRFRSLTNDQLFYTFFTVNNKRDRKKEKKWRMRIVIQSTAEKQDKANAHTHTPVKLPCTSISLQTTTDFLCRDTILTLNIATPLKTTITLVSNGDDLRLITSITAKEITSINRPRTSITNTSERPERASRQICFTIVRTRMIKDQIILKGRGDRLLLGVKGKISRDES